MATSRDCFETGQRHPEEVVSSPSLSHTSLSQPLYRQPLPNRDGLEAPSLYPQLPAALNGSGSRTSRSYSPTHSRSSNQQYRMSSRGHDSSLNVFPNTPSVPSAQLYADPSPSVSRSAAAVIDDQDEENESVGILLGPSKKKRVRKDSYSSFGSSVLPAPLIGTAPRYLDASYLSRSGNRSARNPQPFPKTVPPVDASQVAPSSLPLASDVEQWLQQTPSNPSHHIHVSSADPSDMHMSSSVSYQTVARVSGNDHAKAARPSSTSGFSNHVKRAEAQDRKLRRQRSRDTAGLCFPQSAPPVERAGIEFGLEAENRRVDSIEEWRFKNSAIPTSASADPDLQGSSHSKILRQRKKSSTQQADERGGSLDAKSTLYAGQGGDPFSPGQRKKLSKAAHSSSSFSKPPLLENSVVSSKTTAIFSDLFALSGINTQQPTPIRQIVRWLAREHLKAYVIPLTLLFAILLRWMVGRGSWSGKDASPMFGDFEAQRHWIELTLHLPTSKWYFYDLQYWGLDYPPLTAWVSLACGYVSKLFLPLHDSFALVESRGIQDDATVLFMRASVVVLDCLVYFPAVAFFLARRLEGRGRRTYTIAFASILLQPCLVLIDHGHFQYNSVMLGFATACFAFLYTTLPNPGIADLAANKDPKTQAKTTVQITDLSRKLSYDYVKAAVFFCLSLSFKQMALYYAPTVFAVMLGRCIGLAQVDVERGLALFSGLGLAVVVTFGIVFAPWLTKLSQLAQVVERIFPLARGLFEDKVANVWCFLSVLPIPQRYKLRNLLTVSSLARLSLLTTLLAILPSCLMLYWAASETAKTEMLVGDNQLVRSTTTDTGMREIQPALSQANESKQVTGANASANVGIDDGNVQLETPLSKSTYSLVAAAAADTTQASKKNRQRTSSIADSFADGSEIQSLLAGSSFKTTRPATTTTDSSMRNKLETRVLVDRRVASTLPSPVSQMLPYGLVSTSMAFFLFGFQTHEKSILLPLLPLTLLVGAKGDQWGGGNSNISHDWEWIVLSNNIATFSLYPLLQRDGQTLEYVLVLFLWNYLIGNHFPHFKGFSKWIYFIMITFHMIEWLVPIWLPFIQNMIWKKYPDIYPVVNVLLCTPCFFMIWGWSLKRQWQIGFACGM